MLLLLVILGDDESDSLRKNVPGIVTTNKSSSSCWLIFTRPKRDVLLRAIASKSVLASFCDKGLRKDDRASSVCESW